jgi:hypothetical protein
MKSGKIILYVIGISLALLVGKHFGSQSCSEQQSDDTIPAPPSTASELSAPAAAPPPTPETLGLDNGGGVDPDQLGL